MKRLHWLVVGALIVAMFAVPAWYVLGGVGAQGVPGPKEKLLRSENGRSVVGGGPRLGK